jgi:hypothetical protein
LGGNYYRIARRRVVLPWRGQSIDEWVPAYVDQARPYITKRGKHGYIFRFKILAGFTAGLLTEQFWSDSFCRFISRDCGFTRRGSGARFQQGNQFVLLRFMLRISAVKSVTQPVFEGVMTPVPSPLLKWNRDIGKSRDRMTPFEGCPPGYQRPLVLPCHLCDVGFETCKNGTHRRQYVRGYCTMCDTIDSWIDPEFDDSVCIRCLFKVRINPAKAVLT